MHSFDYLYLCMTYDCMFRIITKQIFSLILYLSHLGRVNVCVVAYLRGESTYVRYIFFLRWSLKPRFVSKSILSLLRPVHFVYHVCVDYMTMFSSEDKISVFAMRTFLSVIRLGNTRSKPCIVL